MQIELNNDNFKITKETLHELFIDDINQSAQKNSFCFGFVETQKAIIAKQIESLKLEYKLWLSEKKKEVDRKVYNSELAKEDAVIAKYRNDYMMYNKKIIDLTFQYNVLTGLAKAHEMKTNLLIALLTNNKSKEENEKKVEEWNNKVEKTKI